MIKVNFVDFDFGVFPNHESYLDVPAIFSVSNSKNENIVEFKFENDSDIFKLMCVSDFLKREYPDVRFILNMPYIPYSRMDRQEESRLFTLKTFANIINSMNFSKVVVLEPHSDVSAALIDRIDIVDSSMKLMLEAVDYDKNNEIPLNLAECSSYSVPHRNFKEDYDVVDCLERAKEQGICLVYPDAGATKRYSKQVNYDKILTCDKERDFNTGRIKKLILNGDASDCRAAIIVDDLSSRGGTFSLTASEIRKKFPNIEKIYLCVTHCEDTIFTGDVLSGTDIDEVFTTDSILRDFENAEKYKNKLHVFPSNHFVKFSVYNEDIYDYS